MDTFSEEMQTSESHLTANLSAFGIGLLLGAGLALLFAPVSGEESRHQVARVARDVGRKVQSGANRLRRSPDRVNPQAPPPAA